MPLPVPRYQHGDQAGNSTKPGTPPVDGYSGFARAFDNAKVIIQLRGRWGPHLWPLFEMTKDKTKDHVDLIRGWIAPLVQDTLEKKRKGRLCSIFPHHPPKADTLLEHLVANLDGAIHIPLGFVEFLSLT